MRTLWNWISIAKSSSISGKCPTIWEYLRFIKERPSNIIRWIKAFEGVKPNFCCENHKITKICKIENPKKILEISKKKKKFKIHKKWFLIRTRVLLPKRLKLLQKILKLSIGVYNRPKKILNERIKSNSISNHLFWKNLELF